jgi:hypothetical protein
MDSRDRRAHPHRPPRHHLPLPAAGRLRRAPDDVPAARGPRPAAAGGEAPDHARALGPALAPRRVRQQRRHRPLRGPRAGAPLRQHGPARPRAGPRARLPARRERGDVAVLLRGGRPARPRPLDRAAAPGPGPRGRALGPRVRAARRRRARGHARHARGHDPRGEADLRLRRAARARHPGAGPHAQDRERHLPRLRGADDRGGPLPRPRRAVRLRLHLLARAGPGRARRRRLDPRLGAGLPAGRRLGRVRPHQRHRRQPGPDPRRRRPRPGPSRAALGHLDRVPGRQPRHDGGGRRDLGRGRRGARAAAAGPAGEPLRAAG